MTGGVYLYFGHTMLTKGSFDDLERLGILPQEGLQLTFYDLDADDQNRPTYLCAEGELHQDEGGHWHAIVKESTFRSVLR